MSEADSDLNQDFYVVKEAARILGVGEHRVRQMLREGELEGVRDPILDRWKIPQHAVHALRDERPTKAPSEAKALEASQSRPDLLSVVRELERKLGRIEGRLELTERTESTIREERDRLLAERDQERDRADRLEEELREERSKGFWARLFGG